MNLIVAVIQDLYSFAFDALKGLVSGLRVQRKEPQTTPSLPGRMSTATLPLPSRPSLDDSLATPVDEAVIEAGIPSTFKTTSQILESKTETGKNTVMYTGSAYVSLFRQPTMEFDGVLAQIPYGAMVMVLESRGRWSRVVHRQLEGWVLRDELLDRSAYVYPDLTIGEPNRSDDPNTLRIRACIEDEFGGGAAELPLQASEYVLYRLSKRGSRIAWPNIRPRTEGAWHKILRGCEGVSIGISACAGCIMEYVHEDGQGHVAYVEAVFPDETISISEADYPSDGIYNERVMTKEEWRELKPIFIAVS